MGIRTPLAQARGLGSARSGTHHWWAQRLSSLALIPLVIWFVIAIIAITGASHDAAVTWVSYPINAGLLILLVAFTFYHGQLGLQVVIEDYVHGEARKLICLLATRLLAIIFGLIGVLSVLWIWLGSAP